MNVLTLFPPVAEPATLPLWTDGAPSHVTEATLLIDRRVCRAMRCPNCRKRGMGSKPQQSGRRYRVVAECGACHATEEL